MYQRALLFGDIIDGEMMLNTLGCIVQEEWERTPLVRPYVQLDAFVVMPNHVHGILFLNWGAVGATCQVAQPRAMQRIAPTNRPAGAEAGSIGAIISQFKSVATKRINGVRQTPGASVWQRNYYEHVIRSDSSCNRIRSYILTNPAGWDRDRDNPVHWQ